MEKLESPLIIAMIDDSRSNNNIIAHKLATFLKYPLINQNDITHSLLTSTKTSQPSDELINNLPFQVVCQITSTQLSLKINVVINFELSDSTHLDKLVYLASSSKARLIIIECETEDNKDVGEIPKLRVDKNSFNVNKIVSDISILLSNKEEDEDATTGIVDESQKKNKIIRQPANDHLHALSFHEKSGNGAFLCKSCLKLCHGSSSYECVKCNEFILHKYCAESASEVKKCPPFLKTTRPDRYAFQETYKCNNCQEFLHECYDCLFQTHLNHGFLPTILYHKQHPHYLNFIIMPFIYNYQYLCCICDKLGSSVSYKCYDCNYDVHVTCILPSSINMKNGQYTFFLRSNSSSSDEPAIKSHCDICHQDIDWGQLFYRSQQYPNLAGLNNFHLKCIPDESQVDVLREKLLERSDSPDRRPHFLDGEKLRKILMEGGQNDSPDRRPHFLDDEKLRKILMECGQNGNRILNRDELIEAWNYIGPLFPAYRGFHMVDELDFLDELEKCLTSNL